VSFNHLLRKQNGGVGLYAGLVGTVAPAETWSLDWQVKGGSVPAEYIKAITSGFQDALAHEADAPVIGATVTITDGRTHSDDSKDQAFYLCAREIVRQVLQRGAPVAWTPIVEVEVEAPPQYQGAVIGGLTGRQGRITASRVGQHHAVVVAEVPLEHMFGYAGALRGATSGTGEFAMDFLRYGLVGSSSPT
jgi:elongation factor G